MIADNVTSRSWKNDEIERLKEAVEFSRNMIGEAKWDAIFEHVATRSLRAIKRYMERTLPRSFTGILKRENYRTIDSIKKEESFEFKANPSTKYRIDESSITYDVKKMLQLKSKEKKKN